jgi:hypothetical protein
VLNFYNFIHNLNAEKCCASDIVVFKRINFSSLLYSLNLLKLQTKGIHGVFCYDLFYAVVKRDNMEKIYMLRTATRSKKSIYTKNILL